MNFFKRFGITFGNKKNKYLPETVTEVEMPKNVQSVVTYTTADNKISMAGGTNIASQSSNIVDGNYRTLAMFDLKIDAPRYEGAIPEATIRFYPLSK